MERDESRWSQEELKFERNVTYDNKKLSMKKWLAEARIQHRCKLNVGEKERVISV